MAVNRTWKYGLERNSMTPSKNIEESKVQFLKILDGIRESFNDRIKTKIGRMSFREEAAAMRGTLPCEEIIGGFEDEPYEPSQDLLVTEFIRKKAMEL